MSEPTTQSAPLNLNKAIGFALVAVLGGGGYGTAALASEVADMRSDLGKYRDAQVKSHVVAVQQIADTRQSIAVLGAEVQGMRRDVNRLQQYDSDPNPRASTRRE